MCIFFTYSVAWSQAIAVRIEKEEKGLETGKEEPKVGNQNKKGRNVPIYRHFALL